jgi:cystathionine gamma-synthase
MQSKQHTHGGLHLSDSALPLERMTEPKVRRMGYCPSVKALHDAVFDRLQHPPSLGCWIFPSHEAANRLRQTLRKKEASAQIYAVEFRVRSGHVNHPEVRRWARFVATLFPGNLATDAFLFWLNHGDCISNRHARFCLEWISAMDSVCEPHQDGFQTSGPASNVDMEAMTLPTWNSSQEEKDSIKWTLARSTSFQGPGMKSVGKEDVFLYPTGMLAIGTIARALREHASGETRAVIYGWVYSGTSPLVKDCGYDEFMMYGHGTEDELDQLQAKLAAGTRITVVFCEITSNPQLYTPNLHRVKQLADEYGFIVVIDDTIGTSINVDILPYADVVTTSLTKIFSGACNVMGGRYGLLS